MADLNLSPEPLNRMKSRLCVENGRSELRFGGLKNRDERFDTGLLAFPRYVSSSLRGTPCRTGSAVCFFVLILNNAPALRAGNKNLDPNPSTLNPKQNKTLDPEH